MIRLLIIMKLAEVGLTVYVRIEAQQPAMAPGPRACLLQLLLCGPSPHEDSTGGQLLVGHVLCNGWNCRKKMIYSRAEVFVSGMRPQSDKVRECPGRKRRIVKVTQWSASARANMIKALRERVT